MKTNQLSNLECGHRNLRMRAWSSARGKPPPAVYEPGTASEDSNRRAVIPVWRRNFLSRSGAEGGRRARFDFPGHDGPLKPQAVGAASTAFFAWERCRDGGVRAALLLLLSGGINDGVAESHRCVATSRGPPTSPRAAPNARGFFASSLGPRPFLSRSGGIKAPLAESTRRAPHQRGPQPEEGMTRWHGRRPKFVRSAWAWK